MEAWNPTHWNARKHLELIPKCAMWITGFHYHSFQSCWGFCVVFRFACFLSVAGFGVPSHEHQTAGQTAQCWMAWLPLLHRSHTKARALLRGWHRVGVGGGEVVVFQCRAWYCALLPFSQDQ